LANDKQSVIFLKIFKDDSSTRLFLIIVFSAKINFPNGEDTVDDGREVGKSVKITEFQDNL
jgi:hypothetical protein